MAKGQIKQKQILIDKNQFEKLCGLQCTETEIAGYFNVCKDTLIEWCRDTYGQDFSTIYEQKKRKWQNSIKKVSITTSRKEPNNGDMVRQTISRTNR